MSKERIIYQNAPLLLRVSALIVDTIVVLIIAVICYFGSLIDNEMVVKPLGFGWLQFENPLWTIVWFIICYPIYYIFASGITDGQTLGKFLTGIRVLKEDNSSTKKAWKLHLKRFFLIRGGTKVVKETDPGVKGL
ncbi:MAG: RDD family protein [Candidatus Odinarchaeota archaeon]